MRHWHTIIQNLSFCVQKNLNWSISYALAVHRLQRLAETRGSRGVLSKLAETHAECVIDIHDCCYLEAKLEISSLMWLPWWLSWIESQMPQHGSSKFRLFPSTLRAERLTILHKTSVRDSLMGVLALRALTVTRIMLANSCSLIQDLVSDLLQCIYV